MPSSGRWVALFAGGFAACGRRGTFPAMGKVPKDRRTGDGLRLRYAPPRSIGPLSPAPLYEGRVPVRSCNSFGAQNLSGWSEFLPGHWALSSPKLQRLRFHTCAWRCRTNASGSKHRHLIRPLRGHLPLKGKALKSKPFAFPFRGRWHGEAVTDEGNGAGYEGGPFEP